MVDTSSSVNVMYRGCFDQMGLGSNQLMASPEPLYGFTGDAMIPMGCIRLPLRIRDPNCQSMVIANFLVIDNPSAYNVIMERPAMNNLNLVVSTRALVIKFPTPHRIGCVRGKQYSARRCYEALKIGLKGKKVNMVSGGETRVSNN